MMLRRGEESGGDARCGERDFPSVSWRVCDNDGRDRASHCEQEQCPTFHLHVFHSCLVCHIVAVMFDK